MAAPAARQHKYKEPDLPDTPAPLPVNSRRQPLKKSSDLPSQPSTQMDVTTSFKLFVSKRGKKNIKNWMPVPSEVDFNVTIIPGKTTLEEFQSLVASGCDKAVANTGSLVLEVLGKNKKKHELNWFVSIPRVKGWFKCDWVKITNVDSYQLWINAFLNTKVKNPEAFLTLRMTNPTTVIKRGVQADLLAKRAQYQQAVKDNRALKRKAAGDDESDGSAAGTDEDDEEDEIDPEDWNDVNFQMRKILNGCALNKDYDTNTPVFINPSDPNKYVVVTMNACQEWAMCILDPDMPGVNLTSPPRSLLPYCIRGAKKTKLADADPPQPLQSNLSLQQFIVEAIAANVGSLVANANVASSLQPSTHIAPAPPTPPAPSSDSNPDLNPPILEYLQFLRLRDVSMVHKILIENDIISHKYFRPGSSLSRNEIRQFGLK
ncbi:hypothetical protein PTTG_30510, partial [Puccinia triticina 1-1 BBBD Race 1]